MMRPTTVILPIGLMALAIVYFLVLIDYSVETFQREQPNSEPIACTTEARLCPDGSAVGRTGPNCKFSLCPGESEIDTFTECEAAGYAVAESYPRQCFANGRSFVEIITNSNSGSGNENVNTSESNTNGNEVACATDVRTCSDGSYVQRVPPACEFASCPVGTEPISPQL